MKPFRHLNAKTLEEAMAALDERARVIAGGTDLLGLLKNKVLPLYPEVLINIKEIPQLSIMEEDERGLRLGALTKLADLAESPFIREKYGILAEAAQSVGSPQIRNMGTLGGNLCQEVRCWYYRSSPLSGRDYFCCRKGGQVCFAVKGDNRYQAVLGGKRCFAASPSDTAMALAALEAVIAVAGPAGERTVPLMDFFTVMGNVLKPHELVTEVRVPRPPSGAQQRFLKFRLRKALDFAVVSVASVVAVEDGVCRDARIVLGAVAPTPFRARQAEEFMKGRIIDAATAESAAQAALAEAKPLSGNAYKVDIARALIKRAILV